MVQRIREVGGLTVDFRERAAGLAMEAKPAFA
jgi:hypothetical protein